ncbi:MAG: hypothetical protein K2J08_12255 [Ruminococcus sp.]|nr:hypothetical protein [Ruminococcus sp.]
MKKSAVIIASLVIFSLCSCGEKKSAEKIQTKESAEIQQEETQPDPYSVRTTSTINSGRNSATTTSSTELNNSATTTRSKTTTGTESTNTETTTANADEKQPDPLGNGSFSYDEDGAVKFDGNTEDMDERSKLSAGQALFESACRTEWAFTVGCPYPTDENDTIQNNFGWTFYRITDENIKTFSDVENDYNKVFSERYPNEDLKLLYIESSGSVYAFNDTREMDYYYSVSKITAVQSETADEIIFTVTNYYDGTDLSPDEPHTEETTFSAVIGSDGKWKAGQFTLPY